MKRSTVSLVIVLALFAGALVLNRPATASHGESYHWGGSGDRTVRIVESTTSKYDAAIAAADAKWSISPYLDLNVQSGPPGKRARKKCSYEKGGIHVCNAAYPYAWAGLAQVWYDGNNHITKARARLNDRHVKTDHDRLVVACHEIGHTLGLGHQSQGTADTCLTPVISTGTIPNTHDYDALENLYTHAHSSHSAAVAGGHETIEVRKVGDLTFVTIEVYL